jgi:hypothetical protein
VPRIHYIARISKTEVYTYLTMSTSLILFIDLRMPGLDGPEKAVNDVIWGEFVENSILQYNSREREHERAAKALITTEPQIGRRSYRRADGRAQIARYTRAIFRSAETKMPRKKSHPMVYKRGFDAFLAFTYGSVFIRGEYWYENPEFFKFLMEQVGDRSLRLHREVFDALFYKTGSVRAAYWRFDEAVAAKIGLSYHMIKAAIDKVNDAQVTI